MNDLYLSVWMITYNHENYIAQALDSVLSQRTTFNFEIVIGDDCSTDKTRQLCEQFRDRHPHKIRLLDKTDNAGVAKNTIRTLRACNGKYVALCEGDDYWIDPFKLQRQVELLESNPSVVLSYTLCKEVNDMEGTEKTCCEDKPNIVDLSYLLREGWFIRTPTIVFRNNVIDEIPKWFYTAYSTDYLLHLLLAHKGVVARLDEVTAVYRRHPGGISIVGYGLQLKRTFKKMILLIRVNSYFNGQYRLDIAIHMKRLLLKCFRLLWYIISNKRVITG